MGAFLVTYPRDRIKAVLFIFIFARITFIPAALLIGFWFLIQLVHAGAVAQVQTGGVAYPSAHRASSSERPQHAYSKIRAESLGNGAQINEQLGHESLDVTLAYLKGKDADSEEAQNMQTAAAWRCMPKRRVNENLREGIVKYWPRRPDPT